MEDSEDIEPIAAHSVRDYAARPHYDEFASPRHAPCPAHIRKLGKVLHRLEESVSDPPSGSGIVHIDVRTQLTEVPDRSRRPDDGHVRGGLRSRLVPHERSQTATLS